MKVEVGIGTIIEQAATDAIELARFLRIRVDFDFNDVHCLAYPDGDAQKLKREFYSEFGSTNTLKLASS